MKRYWQNDPVYKRLLEVIDEYWLKNEDEEEVQIDMVFRHKNGMEQRKHLWWRNPDLPHEDKPIRAVSAKEALAELFMEMGVSDGR